MLVKDMRCMKYNNKEYNRMTRIQRQAHAIIKEGLTMKSFVDPDWEDLDIGMGIGVSIGSLLDTKAKKEGKVI
jgi:hypothetical protein